MSSSEWALKFKIYARQPKLIVRHKSVIEETLFLFLLRGATSIALKSCSHPDLAAKIQRWLFSRPPDYRFPVECILRLTRQMREPYSWDNISYDPYSKQIFPKVAMVMSSYECHNQSKSMKFNH